MLRQRITRLGEGVDARRRLLPLPIARVRNVLAEYRRELESLGAERVLAVATSAIRDSENGEAFLGEVEWSYGFATRLLSGDDEAELTRRGVGDVAAGTLIFDVGGGSTEFILGERRESVDVGSRAPDGEVRRGHRRDRRPRPPAPARRVARPSARSASRAPSRRWPRSTSGWPSTTASACTDTASGSKA